MKTIWAPWRMEYILSEKGGECLFCVKPKESNDRDNLILYRSENVYVIMNKYPYNNGHLMVVPYFHTSSLDCLSDNVMSELALITRYSVDCLRKAFNPEGFNVGINIGEVAGAGIKEHIHIHIVPRWAGDASFMTVLGEVRVVPEHILETYDKLFQIFNPPLFP
ncbi:MAG: HIT domain-containing protein [Nitrospirae bacterium]|nr:HIT domain-containing protein [Nitrospirota bacterium]MCL5062895.1 HIT domain-containing protein [Nitrospirota bacterium]MDA8215653.1 HIT domain-containing protein [Nitrospiraceae bacterium]